MNWNVAQAKQSLSEVLRRASEEPQHIYNRDRLVAGVVAGALLEEFLTWRDEQSKRSVGQAFAELRALCQDEGYALPDLPRTTRHNAFLEALDDST